MADDEELDAAALGLGEDGLRLGLAALGGRLDALGVHPRARVPRSASGAHRLHELPGVRPGAAEEHRERGAAAAAGPRPRGPRGAVVRVGHVDVEEQDVVALDDGVRERPLHRRRRLAAGVRDDHHEPRLGRRGPRASAAGAAPSEVDLGHAGAGRRCRMHAAPPALVNVREVLGAGAFAELGEGLAKRQRCTYACMLLCQGNAKVSQSGFGGAS